MTISPAYRFVSCLVLLAFLLPGAVAMDPVDDGARARGHFLVLVDGPGDVRALEADSDIGIVERYGTFMLVDADGLRYVHDRHARRKVRCARG